MKIMFVKDYIDLSFDSPIFIDKATEGILLNEVTGKIYIEEIKVTLEDVESTYYALLKKELQ